MMNNFFKQLKDDPPHSRDTLIHRQTLLTDNDSSLLFAALGKAEPLILTTEIGRYQGCRSNGSSVRAETDRRMLPSALSPCFALIKIRSYHFALGGGTVANVFSGPPCSCYFFCWRRPFDFFFVGKAF